MTPVHESANAAEPRAQILGVLRDAAPQIRIGSALLDDILADAAQDMRRERGGFLLGNHHPAENVVQVDHFVPAVETQSSLASLVFTHSTWSELHRQLAGRFSGAAIVGWQHTHPGLGVCLSRYDRFVHEHFFSQPWQIALVVDPVGEQFSFFQWCRGEVVDCGFVCVKEP